MRLRFSLILLSCLSLSAQSWDSLQGLRSGDKIKVRQTSGKEFTGTLEVVSAAAISLKPGGQPVTIARAEVRQVQVRSSARRVRRVLIAAGIGIALGIVTDQTIGQYLRNETGESGTARAITYAAPAGVFAALAGVFPAYRTVYRLR